MYKAWASICAAEQMHYAAWLSETNKAYGLHYYSPQLWNTPTDWGPSEGWAFRRLGLQKAGPSEGWAFRRLGLQKAGPSEGWACRRLGLQKAGPAEGRACRRLGLQKAGPAEAEIKVLSTESLFTSLNSFQFKITLSSHAKKSNMWLNVTRSKHAHIQNIAKHA